LLVVVVSVLQASKLAAISTAIIECFILISLFDQYERKSCAILFERRRMGCNLFSVQQTPQ
jgi:hypothetical protein